MNKTTKIIGGIVIIIIVIVLVAVFYKSAPKGTIKIGAILPLTVKATNLGEDAKQAINLALEKLNQNSKIKIEVIFADEKCDAKEAVSGYRELTLKGAKLVIGAICSPSTLAIAPLAEQEGIVLITPGSAADEITQAGDFIFRDHVTMSQKTGKLAEFAVQKFNSIATIYDQSSSAYTLGDKIITDKFINEGKNVLSREGFGNDTTDFKTQLIKIKAGKPEAIYIGGLMPQAGLIIKQMNELGMSFQILAEDGFVTDTKFSEAVGNLSEGIIFAVTDFGRNIDPRFWDLYTEKFGKNPTIFAAQAYDCIMILAKIIKENCHDGNPICVKDALYNIRDYPGVSGTTSFDQNGDAIKPIIIKTIKNGQFVPYENN
ncbi:ABC transporter substrate-binding protein [Patescibacteria group bacterium]|nr:ABC transporter substrate-binding protein [Patescibacteria group bacterium]MBU4458671.1 ABC transporter substrate-binding protein [Patescibacteria group bacterium]MCG2696266.1 ABC transporter substrate-binding protein [Candidatus Portnoybacteria bacterium]